VLLPYYLVIELVYSGNGVSINYSSVCDINFKVGMLVNI
jgi:hypothetical protein